jgi:hypothetical protein
MATTLLESFRGEFILQKNNETPSTDCAAGLAVLPCGFDQVRYRDQAGVQTSFDKNNFLFVSETDGLISLQATGDLAVLAETQVTSALSALHTR